MDNLGAPISYMAAEAGSPVYTSDGVRIGKVEHVLADVDDDIFDGIIVELDGDGHRFADAPQVDRFYERGVVLGLDAEAARGLPEPSENPVALDAGPDDVVPEDLGDKLRRAWDYLSGRY
jgi:hypothetical protein